MQEEATTPRRAKRRKGEICERKIGREGEGKKLNGETQMNSGRRRKEKERLAGTESKNVQYLRYV